jgi:NitT/TauT family transport system permease protein
MIPPRFDPILLMVALLAVWQGLNLIAGPEVIASPGVTIVQAVALVQQSSFWRDAAATGLAFALASVISIAGGLMLGLWLGIYRFAGDVADPILGSLYSIPKITLYPLILLVFGLGMSAKVAFGVIHGILPIAIFSMNAVRGVAPIHLKTARMMRISKLSTAMTIFAPAALPEIVAGIRVGIALTLLGTLIGELFAATTGIGFALIRATDVHDVANILALTLLVFLFAALINGLLHYGERRMRHER